MPYSHCNNNYRADVINSFCATLQVLLMWLTRNHRRPRFFFCWEKGSQLFLLTLKGCVVSYNSFFSFLTIKLSVISSWHIVLRDRGRGICFHFTEHEYFAENDRWMFARMNCDTAININWYGALRRIVYVCGLCLFFVLVTKLFKLISQTRN